MRSQNVSINLKLRDYVESELVTLRAQFQEIFFYVFVFPFFFKFPPNLIIVWQSDLFLQAQNNTPYHLILKGQCHDDSAVLGQFWAKIITLSLYS